MGLFLELISWLFGITLFARKPHFFFLVIMDFLAIGPIWAFLLSFQVRIYSEIKYMFISYLNLLYIYHIEITNIFVIYMQKVFCYDFLLIKFLGTFFLLDARLKHLPGIFFVSLIGLFTVNFLSNFSPKFQRKFFFDFVLCSFIHCYLFSLFHQLVFLLLIFYRNSSLSLIFLLISVFVHY